MRINRPEKRPEVIFIVGPTAIGKTRFAVKLAKKLKGEIVSCDSMQIYKGMDILSQAPTKAERKSAKHHLVNLLSPDKEYSVAIFIKKAELIIRDIVRRGKVPIVVGGSGLYVKALIDGLFPSPPADIKFREKMQKYAARYGSTALHERLRKIDPGSASLIHPNDSRRIIRALELHNSTGRTMTELKSATKGLAKVYDIKVFGLKARRSSIYSRIDSRVDRMFASGAVKEVNRLLARKKLSKTSNAALGIKEIAGYLEGEYDLDEAKDMLKMNTRRFAKRQFTWFRANRRIKWLDVERNSEAKIIKSITK